MHEVGFRPLCHQPQENHRAHMASRLAHVAVRCRVCDGLTAFQCHSFHPHIHALRAVGLCLIRMVQLYSNKVCELSEGSVSEEVEVGLSYLKGKERELLLFLIEHYNRDFTPIEVSREFGVSNKTIINRLAVLARNGFVEPIMAKERIRSYKLSDFTKSHEKELKKYLDT